MGKFKKSNINYIRSQYYSEKEENQGHSERLGGPYLIFIILFRKFRILQILLLIN